jgi:hypothetical protein
MTVGKMTALGLALAGAFALGVWTGPELTQRAADRSASVSDDTGIVPGADSLPAETAAPARTARAGVVTRAERVDISMPELQARLKPVLNRGANMAVAAEGFNSAEQFAMVAHAARNTEVPFLLLKHRVLNEGKSVAQAISESKPTANAAVEAQLAQAQARSDIAAIAG